MAGVQVLAYADQKRDAECEPLIAADASPPLPGGSDVRRKGVKAPIIAGGSGIRAIVPPESHALPSRASRFSNLQTTAKLRFTPKACGSPAGEAHHTAAR